MPEQKGWAGLEPETPKPPSGLKQKRGGQAFSHLKWPGVGQNELAGGPKVLLTATFWPTTFPRARFHYPTFLPLILFGPRELALQCDAPIEMREKMQRAWTWPFSVPDGFCRKWALGFPPRSHSGRMFFKMRASTPHHVQCSRPSSPASAS
jgi:hypothetical protein